VEPTDPRFPLTVIRNKLQVILGQVALCSNPSHCESCGLAVKEILEQIRALEAYIEDALRT